MSARHRRARRSPAALARNARAERMARLRVAAAPDLQLRAEHQRCGLYQRLVSDAYLLLVDGVPVDAVVLYRYAAAGYGPAGWYVLACWAAEDDSRGSHGPYPSRARAARAITQDGVIDQLLRERGHLAHSPPPTRRRFRRPRSDACATPRHRVSTPVRDPRKDPS